MNATVYCTAPTRELAENIVDDLKSAGFGNNDISVLMQDRGGTREFATEHNTKAPEGATAGGVAGMGTGAILGWLAGIGTLAIPGVGPFIAAGPIMAALGGAAIGGATGGIIGALVGMGIPEEEAKHYDEKVRGGHVLISVHTDDMAERDRARAIFERRGAEDISAGASTLGVRGTTASGMENRQRF
ncbi:hypothetical protein [Frateuria sp. STR12]|uniref:hypothetical protein n=1 Tax=Frateuria hangzhouensis TaxID=2995589 RepID=UPI0022609BE8|nr:hypothetical protein [Frateuria sp. STR12]MCX7514724.1 hypothetical protein [Frateuria sp. STR12]